MAKHVDVVRREVLHHANVAFSGEEGAHASRFNLDQPPRFALLDAFLQLDYAGVEAFNVSGHEGNACT